MKRLILILLIGGSAAMLQFVAKPSDTITSPAPTTTDSPPLPKTAPSDIKSDDEKKAPTADAVIVKGVSVKHYDREVYFGDVDLAPTLARIHRGVRLENGSDDETYQNRERVLPKKPSGYWRKYVHPTRGIKGAGPQRVIIGKRGEVYYTPDHYVTFQKVR